MWKSTQEKINKLIEKIDRTEFEEYCKLDSGHMSKECLEKFEIDDFHHFLYLIDYWNIYRPSPQKLKKERFERYKLLDRDELINFLKDHGVVEFCDKFSISTNDYDGVLKMFNITRTPEEIKHAKQCASVRTCLDRYGTTNGGSSPQALEKIKATNLKHWGVECYWQYPEFIKQNQQHQIDEYGGVGFASDILTEKFKQKMLDTYGVEMPMKATK